MATCAPVAFALCLALTAPGSTIERRIDEATLGPLQALASLPEGPRFDTDPILGRIERPTFTEPSPDEGIGLSAFGFTGFELPGPKATLRHRFAVSGELPLGAVVLAVRDSRLALLACYARARAGSPTLTASPRVRMFVSGVGAVTFAHVDACPNETLRHCLEDELSRVGFRATLDGKPAVVDAWLELSVE